MTHEDAQALIMALNEIKMAIVYGFMGLYVMISIVSVSSDMRMMGAIREVVEAIKEKK